MKSPKEPECYTVDELAAHLNVSSKFVRKHIRRIPGSFKIGWEWRFRKIEIERAENRGQLLIAE